MAIVVSQAFGIAVYLLLAIAVAAIVRKAGFSVGLSVLAAGLTLVVKVVWPQFFVMLINAGVFNVANPNASLLHAIAFNLAANLHLIVTIVALWVFALVPWPDGSDRQVTPR